jgi:hypothetical protein
MLESCREEIKREEGAVELIYRKRSLFSPSDTVAV